MQRFMILISGGHVDRDTASPEEVEANLQKWHAWTQYLIEQGHYLAGDALSVQGRRLEGQPGKGETVVETEGPFPESNELVGGYYVLQGASLHAVSELCKRTPNLARGGKVEVRPLTEFVKENAETY